MLPTPAPDLSTFFLGSRTIDNIIITREFLTDEEYNCKLYFTNLRSNSIPSTRGSFLIVHGFGEYSSRYLPFAIELAKKHFEVFLFDFRGFGYSSGVRASTTLKEFFQDLVIVLNNVNKNAPLYVLGHSMGGGVVLSFLKLNPKVKITGVMLSNPFMEFPRSLKMNFAKRLAGSFLSRHAPEFFMNPGVDPHFLTKNPHNIPKIINDRLMIPFACTIMLKTFMDIRDIIFKKIYKNHKISVPLLFLISLKDALCSPEFSLKFYNSLKKQDKRLVLFDDGRHEVIFDEEQPEVLEKIDDFVKEIEQRAQSSGGEPRLFTVPSYVNFNYSVFDWKKLFKFVVLVVVLGYLGKRRKRIARTVLSLIGFQGN